MANDIYKSILPSEYQQVEYIENSGTQYINLGLYPTLNMKIYVRFMPTISGTTTQYILGSRRSDIQISFVKTQATNYYTAGIARGESVPLTDLLFVKNHIYNITAEANETAGTMDVIGTDETEGITQTGQKTLGSYTESVNICLFAFNSRNIHPGMRCYACKIWDNGVLVRDLIPCYRKSDNVAGMYDLANDTFRTTSTGLFTAGSNVLSTIKAIYKSILPSEYQQVEYIETNGNQYIDLGLTGKQTTRLIVDFIPTTIDTNSRGLFGNVKTQTTAISFNLGNNTGNLSRFGNKGVQGLTKSYLTQGSRYLMDCSNSGYYINGTNRFTPNAPAFETNGNLYLFSFTAGANMSIVKLFSFKIYEGTTLVRNMIPCYRKLDDVVGLYDVKNNVFYTNAGTGTFTKGNDILNEITKIYKGNNLIYNK